MLSKPGSEMPGEGGLEAKDNQRYDALRIDISKAFCELRKSEHLSIVKAARRAGVSPNAWLSIEQGKFGPSGMGGLEDVSPRQWRAWTQTALRLLGFYREEHPQGTPDFDGHEFLAALGMDPTNVATDTSVRGEPRSRPVPPLDAWDALRAESIRVGLSTWQPFGPGEKELEESNLETTFGYRLIRAVLGAASPSSQFNIEKSALLNDVIKDGAEKLGRGEYHLLCGVYDTPDRRILNLDFVALPGLSFGLAALTTETPRSDYWYTLMHDLLDGQRGPRNPIVTWRGDAGYGFINGCCNFKSAIALKSNEDLTEIAKFLTGNAWKTGGGAPKDITFIGDALLCHRLRTEINLLRQAGASSRPFFIITGPNDFPLPQYRAGFALRRGDRLSELIRTCFYGEELLSFSAVLAYLYGRLLLEGMFYKEETETLIQHIYLTALPFPDSKWCEKFVAACRREIKQLASSSDENIVKAIDDQLTKTWENQ